MGLDAERSGKSHGRPPRIARSEEAGATTRAGKVAKACVVNIANKHSSSLKPLPKLAAWKRRSRTTWLTLSAEANVQTDQSVVAAEVEASVEATEEGEAEEETLIEDRRDVIRDRLRMSANA